LVILADEPTSAMDEENEAAVVQLLLDAHRHLGSTLVIVTHKSSVANQMERLVALREGVIANQSS
jgi:putative ABC transport system ATP-binding protein